jgi:hypothetical protein
MYQVPKTKGATYPKECLSWSPASLFLAFIPPDKPAHSCPHMPMPCLWDTLCFTCQLNLYQSLILHLGNCFVNGEPKHWVEHPLFLLSGDLLKTLTDLPPVMWTWVECIDNLQDTAFNSFLYVPEVLNYMVILFQIFEGNTIPFSIEAYTLLKACRLLYTVGENINSAATMEI